MGATLGAAGVLNEGHLTQSWNDPEGFLEEETSKLKNGKMSKCQEKGGWHSKKMVFQVAGVTHARAGDRRKHSHVV